MPRPKGIGSRQNIGTGNNQGRQRTTPCDNRWFNCKYSRSKSNNLSSPVIYMPPPLNNSVINPPHLYSVFHQPSRSSQNTPRDRWWFNINDSNSNSNDLTSLVITVPPTLNDSVINPPQMSSVCQQWSISSNNTTPESQASSTVVPPTYVADICVTPPDKKVSTQTSGKCRMGREKSKN